MLNAKPIRPGCKVMVIHGVDTGFISTAVQREHSKSVWPDGTYTGDKVWGWILDPPPPLPGHEGKNIGYDETFLMRIDDPDNHKQIINEDKINEQQKPRRTRALVGPKVGPDQS